MRAPLTCGFAGVSDSNRNSLHSAILHFDTLHSFIDRTEYRGIELLKTPSRNQIAMGRSVIPSALAELSHPTTPEAQVNALRTLKNEIVGHDQRKELAVQYGLVKPLANILRSEARKGGKRRRSAMNGSSEAQEAERPMEWSIDDELRFQSTLVVGSLANGECIHVHHTGV